MIAETKKRIRQILFTKMVASGNDFVVLEDSLGLSAISFRHLARQMCDRKTGVGADGLLVLGKTKSADIRMRIFNADGSEAEMCGNGARCSALYMSRQSSVVVGQKRLKIETIAGIIEAQVNELDVRIKLTEPKDIKLDIPIKINNRKLKVNFVNTGVPHTVIFVQGLDDIDVFNLGREIRFNKRFAPAGANVNFIEIINKDSIRIRTYERGVEDETLACGTGSVASALITACRLSLVPDGSINIHTQSGEVLKVYFQREEALFKDVWLQGGARLVYRGQYFPLV
ncbi:MAG: diaminopimelate epimerase [Candidatus Omnitrophota bacterium]